VSIAVEARDQSSSVGAPITATYRPRAPVSLAATLGVLTRGPYDPTTVRDAGGLWRALQAPTGAVTLNLIQLSDGVAARAWGPGAVWAIEGLPDLLGARDDWSQLDVAGNPLLRDSLRRNQGLRLTRTRLVFEALAPAIIEQKVTSIEAYRSWAQLVRRFGELAPGPAPAQLRAAPTPAQWRRIPSWEWHRAGVDPRRSRALVTAAQVAPALERTISDEVPPAEAGIRMRSLHGIGQWTAAETTQRSHGDPDAVSVGDYNLAAFVGSALTGSRVDDDGMLELLEPWAGQRQRVIRLILASGHRAPRFGPRMPLRDYRTM
jgi:3-methyladenine DNA glycosylase/8-oxoguanine DNA glycosylase